MPILDVPDLLSAPNVYESLALHQQTGTAGWTLENAMRELHRWAEIFSLRFKLELPLLPLKLARLRHNCLGHYNAGFNEFGLRDEMAIDTRHLGNCLNPHDWHHVLGTLLHEQLHCWQERRQEAPRPGPGNYHNIGYRRQAESLGLLVSSRGVSEGYVPDGPFLRLLASEGVFVPEVPQAPIGRAKVGSKLRKWSCACIPAVNVRVAIADFHARCMDCQSNFRLAD